jgi:hypothetical protein
VTTRGSDPPVRVLAVIMVRVPRGSSFETEEGEIA